MVLHLAARLGRRFDDVVGGREIGLTGAEADDVLTGRLECLGFGVDGQGGRLGDGGNSSGDPRHARDSGTVMCATPNEIRIPADLLPGDGRFGSGPSKVRPETVQALADVAGTWMGTSHRQEPVKDVVASVRRGLADLFSLPDGYEVVLGNGGATACWDAATFGLIDERSQHLVFGEFSSKFADAVAATPHLKEPERIESEPGTHPVAQRSDGIDVYALTQNETSTGVAMPIERPAGTTGALVAVDATSGAGALRWRATADDVYY